MQTRNPTFTKELCSQLLNEMDASFLRKMPLARQVLSLEMFYRAQTRDHCQYEVQYEENWKEQKIPSMYIVLAWKNVPKHNFLYRLARVIFQHNLVMQKVNATYIHPFTTKNILMLSFALHGSSGEAAWEAADIHDFLQELVTLKYFGSIDRIDKVFVASKLLRGNLGNLLRTLMNFIHQILVHLDPNLYSLENIEEGLCRHPELTLKLCQAFEQKFHPQEKDLQKFETKKEEFIQLVNNLDTGNEYHDMRRRNILLQGINFVTHVLKSNFYRNNKTAFVFHLDPLYLDHVPFDRKKLFPVLPFAIFYVKGMHFIGFHIRFKDLSRGGLRTIFPQKVSLEINTVFLECYNLSHTQHKKNKDIPEGGAKGVIFLKPHEHLPSEIEVISREMPADVSEEEKAQRIAHFKKEQQVEYLYQTQRAFISDLLSLVNCNPDGTLRAKNIVDYWKKPEYLYLGPDENMHDSMIQWIAHESKRFLYKPGGAFISGKPDIGINHKEHGVTSLGVNIFMHQMLEYLDITPSEDTFSVKMTGGPDGDVAGNQILNLYRCYPRTAKLLALTDVSGTIYDPEGLDLKLCVELFHEGKSIRFYPPEKLHSGGFLLDKQTHREPSPYVQQTLCWRHKGGSVVADWLSGSAMNTLYRHNVHQVKADIFLPCGGRPRSLKDTNYKDFLDNTSVPTAKAIVEGANLYLSPWARSSLEEKGVLIIKDSSANKGGVICSSFEILCGLTLSDEEFLENKTLITQQILERIKKCALDEAELLLKTHKKTSQPLTQISDEISKRINYFTDQILDYLEAVSLSSDPTDPLIMCFLRYTLPLLKEKFSQRLLFEIPDNHKKAIIASHIAASVVYYKGLDWFPNIVDILPLLLQDHKIFSKT